MDQQPLTAKWMGYDSVEDMNADHDTLHQRLCDWLGVPSQSLRVARGENLSHEDYTIANYEEDAVLHLQRFIQNLKKSGYV